MYHKRLKCLNQQKIIFCYVFLRKRWIIIDDYHKDVLSLCLSRTRKRNFFVFVQWTTPGLETCINKTERSRWWVHKLINFPSLLKYYLYLLTLLNVFLNALFCIPNTLKLSIPKWPIDNGRRGKLLSGIMCQDINYISSIVVYVYVQRVQDQECQK